MKFADYLAKIENDALYKEGIKMYKTRFALGDAILHARMARGWTQGELAKHVGTRQANISRIESANANPTLDLIHRLLEVLELNIVFTSDVATSKYYDYEGKIIQWPTQQAEAIQKGAPATSFNISGSSYHILPQSEFIDVSPL